MISEEKNTILSNIKSLAIEHVEWFLKTIKPLLITNFEHGYKHGYEEGVINGDE